MYALAVVDGQGVHFTFVYALSTMYTGRLADLRTEQSPAVENPVKRPKRAKEAAEYAETEHGQYHYHGEYGQFPQEKPARRAAQGGAGQNERYARLERPRRAYQFAEKRRAVASRNEGGKRQAYHKDGKKTVLQQGKPPRKGAFRQFTGRYLVQKFLYQANGTEEAAYRPAKRNGE
jgi:hypothetical protein